MKRKSTFLRMLALLALMLPWTLQAQNAKVSEYDGASYTAAYSSIVGTGTAQTLSGGYVDVALPFAMNFGETNVPANSTLRIWNDGSVTFDGIAALAAARIAPLYYAAGYTTTQVYTRNNNNQLFTIEWRKVVSGNNSYSFQLKLYPGGDIEFCYGPMTLNSSISVLVGMMSSATDLYRVGGANNGSQWDTIYRNTTGATTTRTLSSTYAPAYNEATGMGMVYKFTQPACVKPSTTSATALAWNSIRVDWTVSSPGNSFQVKYSNDANFDPDNEGQTKTVSSGTDTTTTITGLSGGTTYYFYVRKMCGSTPSGWSPMATATTPTGCPNLSGVGSTNVTATGATIYWTTSLAASSFDVRYNLGSDFDPTADEGTLVNTTDTSKTLTGLNGASTYYYYVRANCVSGLATNWHGPYILNTLCSAITVNAENPYTQTFSDGSMPACWNEEVVTGSTHWTFNSYNGTASFSYTPGASARLITPVFNFNPTGAYQVDFYHAEPDYSGGADSLWLYYRTSTSGEWVRLAQYGNHSSTLESETVLLPNPSATYQLAFVSSAYDYLGMSIANVVVRTQPTCPKPSALAIDNATGNSVTLSWTENGTATAWQIAYGLFTNDDDYTIVDATTNPFTVTNLGLGEWQFFVRSNCAANDQSEWFGSVSQTFGYCNPAPSSHDNSGIIGVTFGMDYVVNDNNTTTEATRYQNHSDMIGDVYAGVPSDVSITYATNYTYGTKIWVDLNNDLAFSNDELLYTGLSTNANPTTLVASITIPANTPLGDYRMRIGGTDNDSGPGDACYTGSYGVFRDYTVRVVAAPSCFMPAGLTASNITATSATLAWTELGLSTQWEVKYGPRGFDPNETGYSVMVNTTPTVELAYLEMVQPYDAYVRAICDPEGPTAWSSVCEFRTICPNGGDVEVTGTSTAQNYTLPVNTYYGYSYTQQIITASEIGGPSTFNGISFNYAYSSPNNSESNVNIYIGTTDKSSFSSTTDYVDPATLTLVYSGPLVCNQGWNEFAFTTPFVYDGTGNIVIACDENASSYSGSSYKFYTQSTGSTYMTLAYYSDSYNPDPANLASFSGSKTRYYYRSWMKLISPCNTGTCNPPTTAITLSETEYAATLTFTDVNEETNPTYGIVWGPQGFNPENAGTTVSPINTSTYTISGLAAQTNYDVYVYAICGGTPGRMVRHVFTTPFIPNCKTPIIDGEYGASNITYNTATLTWRQPGDVPQFWTVRYAATDFNPATAAAADYTELTVTSASANLTGLVAGTTYYVYLKATCSISPLDESPWSSMSNANPAYTFTTPTCVVPTAVTASDVTNSTAQIGWTSNATAWTLKYGLAGFDPDMEGTEVACTATTKELTGLDAYAYYDVYVKSNCTATDESDWSNVCNFRTVCPDGGDATIGNGTSTISGVPINSSWGNTYCQQIFTAEELHAAGVSAGNIQGITFTWNGNGSYQKELTIYMNSTDKDVFESTTDWITVTGAPVYNGVRPTSGTAGEQSYVFTTPFEWDGASNIVITTMLNQYPSSQSSSGFAAYGTTGTANRTLYNYRDSYAFTVNDPETSGTQHKNLSTGRANITFMAPCNTSVTCFAPASVSTSITPANVVTVTWTARTDLRPIVNNFEMKYGFAGFNPDIQGSGTLVSNLNNVFNYNITETLESDVDYDVYVRTVCDADNDDYSKWTKSTFHTYPTCWAPSALTVMGTTSNSATLSWAENTPTPATRWEVVYGLPGFNPDRATPIETTNNTEFVVTGLNHSTRYEFYVRAVCSATDHSDWSPVASAFTQCGVWQYADMPLVENFDGVTGTTSSTINNHVLPNCWDYINTSTTTSGTSTSGYPGYPIAYNSASYSHSGNNHMRFYTYTTAAYGDQYAILPQFGFDLDTVVVGFYARESSTTATYVGTIEVGVMSDPDDANTFVPVETVLPTTTSYEYFEVNFEGFTGTGRYIALRAPKPSTGYNVAYVDDLTVKLREKVNSMDAGSTLVACNEYVMPDTTGGSYPNNLTNATYVIRPAEAGKVAHISGTYDLEYGYDYLNVYRGAVNANNLIGRYTGTGTIDYKTTSNLWADSGYVTLVLTTDADNAFPQMGFKLLIQCEDPEAAPDSTEVIVENGSFAWRNGETYTNAVVRDGLTYDPSAQPTPDMDRNFTATYTYVNVAGVDSVTYNMELTLHPSYNLTYDATICQRDEYTFYGNTYTTTSTYTVAMQSEFGADSIGILNLQVNPAPTAAIYNGGSAVTEITGHCDNADLTLLARSNDNSATFAWEDNSTAATRVVNPHESNTYTVVATNPTTGCTSLPASITVTTTPVPALTISGDVEICYGQSATLTLADANNVPATYRWSNGATTTSITVNPTTTTTYTVTATTSNTSACQATAEFTVVVNPLPVVTATASVNTICSDSIITLTATAVDGYSYSWNTGAATAVATTVATATGAYTVTVTDQNGCVNNFTTATVTVNPSYELSDSLNVCYLNNPYTWGAQQITANGNYDQMFTAANGCDSLIHLAFNFEQMGVENSNIERCYGTTYTFENITRIASVDTALTYTLGVGDADINGDILECPKRYNLAVKVNPVKATTVPQVACDTYTWPVSGETYTVSGDYPYTLATTKNCDSVVTLNLTVNYQNTGVETVTACDNYVWDLNGVSYTATTNEPTFTLQNQWGCDSVVTLDLTVNYRSEVTDGIEFVTGTNAVGCNEIAQLHLIMNPAIDSLNWTNVEACDEYEIANAVVFTDADDCNGHIEPLYLRESGDYIVRVRATDGHDQVARIHLTITPSTYHTTIATECLPYTWTILDDNNNPFEVATITAEMVNGANPFNMSVDLAEAGFTTSTCSSIEVLRLTPKYPTEVVDTVVTICGNGNWVAENSIVFNGADYATGIYTWDNSTLNADGCKLTRKVDLTVNPVYNTTADLTFCESEFTNNALTVVNANNDAESIELTIPGALNEMAYNNTVVANWTTALGCDSIVTINYTVNPTTYEEVFAEACYEYTWNLSGESYRFEDGATQDHEYTSTNNEGCNFITTLHLTLKDTVRGYETRNVCTSFEYNGVTYHTDKTFVERYDGDKPVANGCDSVTYITFHIQQTELIHQYVLSNRPYTWQNGQTFDHSVENVYFDAPGEGDCGNVYSLHLNIVDPIVFCDNAFPYNTGINGIVLEDGNRVVDTASFCLNNPYAGTVGGPTDLYWGAKFNANRTADWYNVFGANLYYVNGYPGTYTLNIYAGGDNAPSTLLGTKTISFDANEETGWKYFELDAPVNVDNSANLWVTFEGHNLGYPISVVQYYDENDQNGAWVSTNGTNWESLNENNSTLFYSFMIKTVYSANMWRNNNPNGNDTILYYTVNPTYNTTETKDVCDSYTWEGTTYTESGNYTVNYTSVEGCDSVLNLNLTIRNATAATMNVTVCDSYTWAVADGGNDSVFTVSGTHVNTITNVAGCDSVITLNLTINKNNGVETTVNNGCDSYTWTDGDGQTYTVSGDYSFSFTDANGCVGDSVLHLTINPSYVTNSELVVNEAGSYTYLGVMYTAPFDSTITYTFQSINGCDSTDNLHLIIPVVDDNEITEVEVEACGSYTWTISGVEHTYIWIPMSERQSHGMALYKDATFNKYVYTYPTDTTFVNGVMTHVDVLHLNLLESTTSTETLNIPVSLGTYTINGVAGAVENVPVEVFTFTYADRGTTFDTLIAVGSVAYCDDYRTYTINYIDNYDTTEVYACADATSYEWNNVTYTIGEPGHTYYFSQKENEGTLTELVHVVKINQRAVNAETITATACDSYVWASGDSLTYTTSVSGVVYNYTDANGCAATKTLNLTVNYNTNSAITEDVCDTYTWTAGNGNTYTTSGDYLYNYNATAAGNCPSVDTLHLTIRNNTNQTIDTAACETFTWSAENGGDGRVLTASGTETYNYTAANGCPSVNTLNLTINTNTNETITKDECDTYTWTAEDGGNGQAYTVSGTYTYDYNTAQGCPSTNTLNLTIRTSTSSVETLAQCDSYTWTDGDGLAHTESGVYTYTGTNVAGCDSLMTLNLTINVNNTGVTVDTTVCDEFTWDINNRYYNTSGTYTASTSDVNGCATTNTLNLVVNSSNHYDSVLYISDGSYRYYGQNATELFGEGVYNRTEHYTNVAGCDSALNITFNVGTALLGIDNVVNCNEYTWRNGETYVWISDAERAANLNSDNDAPLYKTSTGTYIYYNPTYTVPRDNAFDSIYMLALTLTQSYTGYDEVTLNISDREVTYGNSTFNFDTLAVLQQDFVNTDKEFDVHFPAVQHCDSVIVLTVHLVNNYQEVVADAADICVTTDSYSWRNHIISTATTDYDHAHTYYVYDTLATGTIEYIVVNQHPLAYATERRTACDSYEWNGTVYTESTSNATAYFPAGTVINGQPLICDSTVTLMLTINHNTSTEYTVAECNTYTWTAANGGNGETYTESGDYTYDYFTNKGCASTNTLHLTINLPTSTEYTVDECDTYTWTVAEGGDNRVLTATGTYTYDYNTTEGCASTNTLNLTIRNNSNQTVTKTACDTYTWTAEENGDGQTYTTSGVYTFDYTAANGCPSTNTLNLTVNQNSGHTDDIVACDSTQWHGTWYYADNNTATYDYVDGNNCPSVDVLNLTVNHATHNSETVVACQTYTWHGTVINNPSSVGDMFHNNYEYSYVNDEGCPSVDYLDLTLGGGRTFGTETVSNCGPYTWVVNDSTIGVIDESVETSTSFLNTRTGCDSVVFLNLTIFEAPVNDIAVAICDSELPYTWIDGDNTTVLTEAGEATVTYPFSANCDSTVRLTLTVNPTEVTNLTDQICLGNAYTANGFNIAADELATAGVYNFVDHRTTDAGCEHTYNLTLTVGDVLSNTLAAVAACDSYTWNNTVYTESGNYESAPYANVDGCTTIDILPLTINVNAGTEYTEVACDNFMWNGTSYTESGDYTYDFTDGNGCAGTDVLHLTINNSVINNIEKTACDSYTWTEGNGETYTTSGVYSYSYTTTDGCNGTDYLVLTINSNSNTEYTETVCDSYVWNGTEYNESGDYEYEYEAANGCPSKDILHLTVNNSTTSEETAENCNFYNWHGETYTTSGDYTYVSTNDAGCQHTATLHLTINTPVTVTIDTTVCDVFAWNGINYLHSDVITHSFTAANGCDSTEIINLTVNNPVSTTLTETACDSYIWPVTGLTYTESDVYMAEFVAANGCDSIIYLHLTVNHNSNSSETVTACDSYTWNGQTYTTSGTQTYAYNSLEGCPSVDTLYLTINNSTVSEETAAACNSYTWNGNVYSQSGDYTNVTTNNAGCADTAILHLTINTPVTTNITETTCNSYTWNGATYTTSGIYTNTFTAANGCDSIVNLMLTISAPVTSTVNATACDSYTWNGTAYTTSGTYTYNGTAANGCDSIVTLNLVINSSKTNAISATACNSYTWNGATYTTTGSYTQTFTTTAGCDSVVTLALAISPAYQTEINQSSCSSYTWNGNTYTTSGNYTHTYTAANGCDSIVTLHLTVTPTINMTVTATACDSYTWNGTVYTTSGNYTHTYTAAAGCDSVVTLALTINNSATGTATATACDSYTWNGTDYTTSGNYTHTYTAANGCDSVVTLTLTVNNSVAVNTVQTVCDSYTWNGMMYVASGVYTQSFNAANGCDSTVTLTLTVNNSYHSTDVVEECDSYIWIDGNNYTTSTTTPTYTYTAANGCDSVITLNLTINYSVEIYDSITILSTSLPFNYRGNVIEDAGDYFFNGTTVSGCDSSVYLHVDVQTVGIDVVNSLDDITIYPNPTRGRVTVTADEVVKIEVMDIVGRRVATFENTNTFDISDLGEGAYTLRITLPNGTTVRKVVKK